MIKVKRFLACLRRSLLLGFLGSLISLHGKRILFIASLYFWIQKVEPFDRELIEKLNQVMGLAKSNDALLLPANFRHWFWDDEQLGKALMGCDGFDNCNPHDVEAISKSILSITPQWLRYGREQVMMNDLRKMLFFQGLQEHERSHA